MSRLATRRLIDAAATLDPADRALLNIWINRGLDDSAVARMTGLSEETIAERRDQIVAHLSHELGLPPEHVRGALTEITLEPGDPADQAPAATVAADETSAAGAEALATDPDPDPDRRPARRRRRATWLLAATALLVAVVLIGALGSGGSSRRLAAVRRPTIGAVHTIASTSSPTGRPLVALPGGVRGATGTVQLNHAPPDVKLIVKVRNLRPVSRGHYEIWLYDTLVTSRPLGRLGNRVSQVALALGADAHRYRWIDISFQPPGVVFHSGDSILRAANPLFVKPR